MQLGWRSSCSPRDSKCNAGWCGDYLEVTFAWLNKYGVCIGIAGRFLNWAQAGRGEGPDLFGKGVAQRKHFSSI